MLLRNLDVLIFDCQTTGASPARGHLLEAAWLRARASGPLPVPAEEVETHLSMLPPPSAIPRRISRLTGIVDQDLARAVGPEEIWSMLSREAAACAMRRGDAREGEEGKAPLVAHFARFEIGFLRDLHERQARDTPFPFLPLCTHAVAARLLPGLPRKGLRAVAGYFGHSMKRHRRAAAHVAATAEIWKNLVEILERDHGVSTMDDLFAWLRAVPVLRRARREYAIPREGRLRLPEAPGVYRMMGRRGAVLYVGKAASLRRRVNGYFQKQRGLDDKTLEMLSQVWKVEVSVTATALEAALLESDEIKRLRPPYNRALTAESSRLWFAAEDFKSLSPVPDRAHTVGPLGSRALFLSMGRLGEGSPRIPGLGESDEDPFRFRTARSLDELCLQEGLELFRERHGLEGGVFTCADLVRTGAALRREAMARKDRDENEGEEEGQEHAVTAEPEWTAEAVARALERAVSRAAHQVRRARWLCLLSESSLAWPLEGPGRGRRLLVLEGGRIAARQDLMPRGHVPVPPGFRRTFGERQWSLTVRIYDRLRVLTTELRRMAGEGSVVEVRLGPGSRIRGRALRDFLGWV